MKLLNKLKITLLIAFFIIIVFNLKSFAVTGTITEITVNMRKEPSTNSKRLMYVTQDYKVEVLEKVGEWYKIKYKGVTGYVFGKYVDVDDSKLKVEDTQTEEPKQEEVKQEDTTNKKEDTTTTDNKVKEPIQDVTTDVPVELQIKEKTTLRLIPNISSSVIYTAKKEVAVEVIEQYSDWSYVYVDSLFGWVRTDNIVEKNAVKPNTETEEDDTEIEYTERTVAYIKYTSVNLRKKASTSSTVLAKLKLNNEVIVLEKVNSTWTKVEYDGITGYVSADLLSDKKVEDKEESTSTSRDGETVSRDEDKKEDKESVKDTENKKEENVTNKKEEDKNTNTENKKEETNNQVKDEPEKETIKENEDKKEDKEPVKDTENKKEDETTSSKNETTTSKTKGEEIAEYAQKFVGYKYVYGGASPKTGFDCSGLTSYVYKQFGYTLSRTSKAQAKNGREVSKDELQPGDLLIFKNQDLKAIGHVGIYIGNNKMVHASEPGIGVVITKLNASGYNYDKRFVTARRIVD